ncbi:hypothetical protein ACWEOE_14700 [Amycolatopsis sp. NPDC004368]
MGDDGEDDRPIAGKPRLRGRTLARLAKLTGISAGHRGHNTSARPARVLISPAVHHPVAGHQ